MKMKTLVALLMLCASLAQGQILSLLLQTNSISGTNRIPVVMRPLVTNGTRTVTVDNLFSNRTLNGVTSISNLNGMTFWTTNWTPGTDLGVKMTNVYFTVPLQSNTAALLEVSVVQWDALNLKPSGFHSLVCYYATGALAVLHGALASQLSIGTTSNALTFGVSGTNIIVSGTATDCSTNTGTALLKLLQTH